MADFLLPSRLYVVQTRVAPSRMLGHVNAVFGFTHNYQALRVVQFLDGHRPEVFYAGSIKSNQFRLRHASDSTWYAYTVTRIDKDEYTRDILGKNVSIRLIESVERAPDISEILITSPLDIEPIIEDKASFLESAFTN